MASTQHTLITVTRNPGDRRRARYWIEDIEDPHWHYESGGIPLRSRQPALYAFVICTGSVDGEVAHFGAHGGPCPHRIVVHIPPRHNDRDAMDHLRNLAGSKPRSRGSM